MADATSQIAAIDAGVEKAAKVKTYRLSDGTFVDRTPIGELLDARDRIAERDAIAKRRGLFVKVATRSIGEVS